MKRQINKILFTLIMLAGVGLSASAGSYCIIQQESQVVDTEETITEDSQISDFAPPIEVEETEININADVNDQVPVIRESKIARKMTQAEKNQNAKENDSWGGAITIIAMCIVIAALAVLAILFFCFGKVSEAILTRTKKKAKKAAAHVEDEAHHELASGEVIAAISLALSEHFDGSHDVEDTILTIRRMKKSYSPWNSKIYNIRTLPELSHKQPDLSALSKR